MSSFKDLQKIYEGGYRGMSYNPSPNRTYTAEPSNHSFKQGFGFGAGDSDNLYAANAVKPITAIADDEEHHATGVIGKTEVIKKIKDLMKTANDDEMMYAVHLLGQLKEFIKSN